MSKRLLLLLVISLVLLCGCTLMVVRGSGNVVTETREVSGFDRVEVCCGMQLFLVQGDQEGLTLEGDDNILAEIESNVRGGTLSIRYRDMTGPYVIRPSRPVIVNLQMANIHGIEISGGGSLEAENIESDEIALAFSGGSHGTIGGLQTTLASFALSGGAQATVDTLTADVHQLEASGSSQMSVNGGTVTTQQVEANGSSSYYASELQSENCALEASGGSEAHVWVTESLQVRASGSSRVEYSGNPAIDQEASGGSRIVSVNR